MLDAYLFESVSAVQDLSDEWLRIYNERRPHETASALRADGYPAARVYDPCVYLTGELTG